MTLSNCPVCSGLLLPDEDDFRCVNCGRRFYSGQPSNDQSRTCRDCGEDISGLPQNFGCCLLCKENSKTELEPLEEPESEPRPQPPDDAMPDPEPEPEPSRLLNRVCQDCKEDISGRAWNCVRCIGCQKAADKAVMAQSNQELHRRRQEKFGTNLVKCPVCGEKFAPGRSLQMHQRRAHANSSTPPKVETRSCQAESEAEPEGEPVLPEYTPNDLDELVENLLKERSFGGKGHTISGANLVLAYIDAMIIVTEVTHQEAEKDLAALCRVRELLGDNQDEEQTQPVTVASDT